MEFDHSMEHEDPDMLVVQANIDDMNPEYTARISDRLFENGAHDVYWIPIIMKKGRPGLMLNVLTKAGDLEKMETIIFEETTTLGLRYWRAACRRLGRRHVPVRTPWGTVRVKIGIHKGQVVQYAPEFRECEEISRKYRIPLKKVYDQVRRAYLEEHMT